MQRSAEVFRKKMTLESMTAKELTIICKPLKRKDDGKMPTKKEQLILKYKEWNGRPAPLFDTSHLIYHDINQIKKVFVVRVTEVCGANVLF